VAVATGLSISCAIAGKVKSPQIRKTTTAECPSAKEDVMPDARHQRIKEIAGNGAFDVIVVGGGINGIGGSKRGAEALIRVLYEAVGAREGWSTAEGRVRALLRAAGALGGS
jgi:hypothetical protein